MILTVTPNPALDVTYLLPSLEPGETHQVPKPLRRAGGKAINVARVLNQQGESVLAIAAVGGRTGIEFQSELQHSGVPHQIVQSQSETRSSITIFDESNSAATTLNEVGDAFSQQDWSSVHEVLGQQLGGANCLVASGSLPPGAPTELYEELVVKCRTVGLKCLIDARGDALLSAAEAGATVVTPNRRELAETSGTGDLAVGIAQLFDHGAEIAMVSLGADGMLAASRHEPHRIIHARLPMVLSGNPTGAGDAANAGVALRLAEGQVELDVLLRTAVAWGGAAVLMRQAGEISPRHTEFLAQVQIGRWAE